MPQATTHEKELSFFEHLEELRWRLIWSLTAIIVGTVIGWFVADKIIDVLVLPIAEAQEISLRQREAAKALVLIVGPDGSLRLQDPDALDQRTRPPRVINFFREGDEKPFQTWTSTSEPIQYIRPMDPFMIRLKAAIIIGVFLSLPVILYQIWAFISPGLVASERKLAFPLILAGSLLFPLGATFAYFMLEFALLFFSQFVGEYAVIQNDAQAYLGFALTMMLAFGIVFELPLAIILATRVGLVSVEWLSSRRSYIFITLLVIAAIVTPTGDPITLLALALPLQILFELALITSRILNRVSPRELPEETESPENREES